MIKLVQGFDIISPLPIDGRILLSSGEMKEIADYLLPEKYFAICRDDGKLYIYDKNNVITDDPNLGYGRFRKASKDANSYTDQKAEELDNLILGQNRDSDIPDPDSDQGVYGTLWNKITNESVTWATNLRTETSTRIQKDDELSAKIDNYKVNQNLINASDLETELLDYSTVDNTARYIKAYVDNKYRLILQLEDSNHRIISTDNSVDLPLENLVVDIDYVEDSQGKALLITLQGEDSEGNHKVLRVPLDAMIAGLVSEPIFNAHVDDLDAHLRDGERAKWDNMAENAITSSNLSEHIVSGSNTTVSKVAGTDTVKIDAVDTTYVAGEGIGISPVAGSPYTYRITTESSAPSWESITGNDPRVNESLDSLFDSIESSIGSKQSEITSSNKLDADLVDDTSTSHKFVSASEKTTWNGKQDKITSTNLLSHSLVEGLSTVASTGAYSDLTGKPTINNGKLTLNVLLDAPQADGTTFTANQSVDTRLDIKIPNNTNQLTNGANFQNATQVSSAISTHNSSSTAHSDIRGLITGTNGVNSKISAIEGKIPSAASTTNKLADKEYVNSSIATSTATFRGTVTASADTDAAAQTALNGITTKDDNDYAFVQCTDSAGNTKYKRYKYNGSAWVFEYTLNNSSFTADQWSTINSGITSAMLPSGVSSTNKLATASDISTLNTSISGKQATLVSGTNIKTINGSTLLGNGGLEVGTVRSVQISATSPIVSSTSSAQTGATVSTTITHAESTITPQQYGPTANATLAPGSSVSVPSITFNSTGHGTAGANRTITIPGIATDRGLAVISDNQVGIKTAQITIPANATWTAAAGTAGKIGYYYTATTGTDGALAHITANSKPVLDVDMSSVANANEIAAINEAWSKIYRVVTETRGIRFYSTEQLTTALTINVKG